MPEPYRIKMVEPIRLVSRERREEVLREADYNMFSIAAEDVFIDLLTDSGTGAMSADQWSAIFQGDESYAGSRSYYELRNSITGIFGMKHVLPTHQGRGAERILFQAEVKAGDIVPSNAHFDTTRANLTSLGARGIDLPVDCANDPQKQCGFKGNMHADRLRELLSEYGSRIPFVMVTITNNRAAGQPVSMANIREISSICRDHGKLLIIDACRHAENAFLIKQRDPNYRESSILQITHEFFQHADGLFMSAKKDGLCNIGGFLAFRKPTLHARLKEQLVLAEGFETYGGLAGRDLAAMSVGLWEGIQEEYLAHRIGQVEFLADQLREKDVPLYVPAGGHAVYIDVGAFFGEVSRQLPGQSLAAALYLEGGIRTCDLGSTMFSNEEGWNGAGLRLELLRLALPWRTYTESHLRYVAEVFGNLARKKDQIPDYQFLYKPELLSHFYSKFEQVNSDEAPACSMSSR